MAKKPNQSLPLSTTRVTRTIYFFLGFFALSIVIFDSGNLITREAVINRWTLLTALLVTNTAIWLISSKSLKNNQALSITALATVALLFAGFMTYWERGMASTSTVLYALPLLIITTIKNRHALIAFAVLSAASYAFAAVKYFNDFFNEGYRVQLWGSIVLYSGTIFAITWLLMIIAGLRKDSQ
jgi:hypothetical protein